MTFVVKLGDLSRLSDRKDRLLQYNIPGFYNDYGILNLWFNNIRDYEIDQSQLLYSSQE